MMMMSRFSCKHLCAIAFGALMTRKGCYFLGFLAFLWLTLTVTRKTQHAYYKCTTFSPAYPSLGGPGCKYTCTEKEGLKNSSYAAVYWAKDYQIPDDLVKNMKKAAAILKRYGKPISLDTEKPRELHVTFDYYCCYTEHEAAKIGQFLNTYHWKRQEVWFDNMVCAVHGLNGMVSLVLMLDRKSQHDMSRIALKNERDLKGSMGIEKHIPRDRLQDFHMTLGVVDQTSMDVWKAVDEINDVIPRGKWHKTPLVLLKPVCHRCQKLVNDLISGM